MTGLRAGGSFDVYHMFLPPAVPPKPSAVLRRVRPRSRESGIHRIRLDLRKKHGVFCRTQVREQVITPYAHQVGSITAGKPILDKVFECGPSATATKNRGEG